jgi:hypothetical protein
MLKIEKTLHKLMQELCELGGGPSDVTLTLEDAVWWELAAEAMKKKGPAETMNPNILLMYTAQGKLIFRRNNG